MDVLVSPVSFFLVFYSFNFRKKNKNKRKMEQYKSYLSNRYRVDALARFAVAKPNPPPRDFKVSKAEPPKELSKNPASKEPSPEPEPQKEPEQVIPRRRGFTDDFLF